MARPIDEKKNKKVRHAAIVLFTTKGYANTTVDMIAKKSGVSTGYLYRDYPSKLALLHSLYEEWMAHYHDSIMIDLENVMSAGAVIDGLIDYLHETVRERPEVFDFIYLLIHDHTLPMPRRRSSHAKALAKQVLELGHRTGEVEKSYDAEMVFYIVYGIVYRFFSARMRKVISDQAISEKDIARLKLVCRNALAPSSKAPRH